MTWFMISSSHLIDITTGTELRLYEKEIIWMKSTCSELVLYANDDDDDVEQHFFNIIEKLDKRGELLV